MPPGRAGHSAPDDGMRDRVAAWAVRYASAATGGPPITPSVPDEPKAARFGSYQGPGLPAIEALPPERRKAAELDPDVREFLWALGDVPRNVPTVGDIEELLVRWAPGFFGRFKRVCGVRYADFRWKWPLHFCRKVIEDTGWGEKRVVLLTDFSSPSTMVRAFTRYFWTSPSECRARRLEKIARGEEGPVRPPAP